MARFRLLHGRHVSSDFNEVAVTRRHNERAIVEARGVGDRLTHAQLKSPQEHQYSPGDVIEVDEANTEELNFLRRDKQKFMEIGADGTAGLRSDVHSLQAENARLRALLGQNALQQAGVDTYSANPHLPATDQAGRSAAHGNPLSGSPQDVERSRQHGDTQPLFDEVPGSGRPTVQSPASHPVSTSGPAQAPAHAPLPLSQGDAGGQGIDPAVAAKLDRMSLAQLKAFATEEEIDIGPATSRVDVLKVVHAALRG